MNKEPCVIIGLKVLIDELMLNQVKFYFSEKEIGEKGKEASTRNEVQEGKLPIVYDQFM